MNEIWKQIEQFPDYEVSDLGRIRSLDRQVPMPRGGMRMRKGAVMSLKATSKGYRSVYLYRNGIARFALVHRLVAEAFIPKPVNEQATIVNHKDGDKTNNHVMNLEWVTAKENTVHAVETGLHPLGEMHGGAKLNRLQVREIRRSLGDGQTQRSVARRFGVSQRTICAINTGRLWGHLSC